MMPVENVAKSFTLLGTKGSKALLIEGIEMRWAVSTMGGFGWIGLDWFEIHSLYHR